MSGLFNNLPRKLTKKVTEKVPSQLPEKVAEAINTVTDKEEQTNAASTLKPVNNQFSKLLSVTKYLPSGALYDFIQSLW